MRERGDNCLLEVVHLHHSRDREAGGIRWEQEHSLDRYHIYLITGNRSPGTWRSSTRQSHTLTLHGGNPSLVSGLLPVSQVLSSSYSSQCCHLWGNTSTSTSSLTSLQCVPVKMRSLRLHCHCGPSLLPSHLGSRALSLALTDWQHWQQQQQVRQEMRAATRKPVTVRPRIVKSPIRWEL